MARLTLIKESLLEAYHLSVYMFKRVQSWFLFQKNSQTHQTQKQSLVHIQQTEAFVFTQLNLDWSFLK